MIVTGDVVALATTLADPAWVVKGGPIVPDMPDRLVLITRVGGSPHAMEGVLARPGYQFRIRGPANNPELCEREASRLTEAMLEVATQTMVGDVPLIGVNMIGTLAPLPGTPDSGGRTEYVVTFVLTVAAR